ncbi:MAG: PHP domain-containing protein [Anaerolineae bacterium]
MRIDLHVHTEERSLCGRSGEEAMVQRAIERGLGAIAITDHDRLVPPSRLAMLNAKYAPFRVFGGIEVSLGLEHVLVLGVQDPLLEQVRWSYAALHDFVERAGGFIAWAHPFRFRRCLRAEIAARPPHALEIYSHNTPGYAETQIRELAEEWGARMLANSDAHHVDELGSYYNELAGEPQDVAALVRMLRAGAFTPVASLCERKEA